MGILGPSQMTVHPEMEIKQNGFHLLWVFKSAALWFLQTHFTKIILIRTELYEFINPVHSLHDRLVYYTLQVSFVHR